jgi:hypothetical protein
MPQPLLRHTQLRVDGFRWHCNVVIRPPVMTRKARRELARLTAPEEAQLPTQQTRRVLRSQATWKHVNRASMSNQTQVSVSYYGAIMPAAGFDSRQPFNMRPASQHTFKHVIVLPQVWVLLSNFHSVSIDQYARMLWLHTLWHMRFGVRRYLLHVSERLGELLAHPSIQDLIRRDLLMVVLFDELPRHEKDTYQPNKHDVYAYQASAAWIT